MGIKLPENLIITNLRGILEEGESLFLVGGTVRDFFLNRASQDYDFLLEGDVFSFVAKLKEKIGGKVIYNKRLLTATLKINGLTLDFATARRECYPNPGDIPLVTPASWQEDLKRRDFTINTLVIPLLKNGWGEVIDLWGGMDDLKRRLIRILHEQSFRDDPTRILRAIRYKNRLGFTLENNTLLKLKDSWRYLEKVSPRRRFKEWQLLCQEDKIVENIRDICLLCGWPAFTGGLSKRHGLNLAAKLDVLLTQESVPQGVRNWYFYLLILLETNPERLADIDGYWGLYPQEKERLQQVLAIFAEQEQLKKLPRRQLLNKLKKLPPEGSYYLYRKNKEWGKSWEDFQQEIQGYKLPIQGKDLINLGIRPGPEVGRILQRLEEYYQHNLINTKREGLKLAKEFLEEEN